MSDPKPFNTQLPVRLHDPSLNSALPSRAPARSNWARWIIQHIEMSKLYGSYGNKLRDLLNRMKDLP